MLNHAFLKGIRVAAIAQRNISFWREDDDESRIIPVLEFLIEVAGLTEQAQLAGST